MFTLLSKVIIGAAVLSFLTGTGALLVHQHDARVVAEVAAKVATVNLATERADNARLLAALGDLGKQTAAQATAQAHIKEDIAGAKPSSFSCIRSPRGRAALGGLRGDVGSH